MDYYLLFVWGCVEPELVGPFKTTEERDSAGTFGLMDSIEAYDPDILLLDVTLVSIVEYAGLKPSIRNIKKLRNRLFRINQDGYKCISCFLWDNCW